MEAFGEYRVGHNDPAHKHWIECRGEVIAYVESTTGGSSQSQHVAWHYNHGSKDTVHVKSEIPTWEFEGDFPSIGHSLVSVSKSHRRFLEPNAFKRIWREVQLWPLWGKLAALGGFLCVLGAVAEVLSFVLPILLGSGMFAAPVSTAQ